MTVQKGMQASHRKTSLLQRNHRMREVTGEDLDSLNQTTDRFVVNSSNFHVLEKMLDLIDFDTRINNGYQWWLDVCFALHSVYGGSDEGYERFIMYSVLYFADFQSDSARYHKEAEEKWASSNKDGGRQLGLTQLIKWAVEDTDISEAGEAVRLWKEVHGKRFTRVQEEPQALCGSVEAFLRLPILPLLLQGQLGPFLLDL